MKVSIFALVFVMYIMLCLIFTFSKELEERLGVDKNSPFPIAIFSLPPPPLPLPPISLPRKDGRGKRQNMLYIHYDVHLHKLGT